MTLAAKIIPGHDYRTSFAYPNQSITDIPTAWELRLKDQTCLLLSSDVSVKNKFTSTISQTKESIKKREAENEQLKGTDTSQLTKGRHLMSSLDLRRQLVKIHLPKVTDTARQLGVLARADEPSSSPPSSSSQQDEDSSSEASSAEAKRADEEKERRKKSKEKIKAEVLDLLASTLDVF